MLIDELERKLDSFDSAERREALLVLCEQVNCGQIKLPEAGSDVNMHCHSFFSYNSYGYSPSKFAWLGRKAGLAVAGVVDFDVLDGLEEFLEAAKIVGLKACAGLETRVFVPEFSARVINSPGEPGISYYMGAAFAFAELEVEQAGFLKKLRQTAQQRNKELTGRVNEYLRPVELDYEKDVLVLTPSGNSTERHICLAYARKASEIFKNKTELIKFWVEKLGLEVESFGMPESRELLNVIRAKTMKGGGVGYVQPGEGAFVTMAEANQFFLAAGAIPTFTWLDGTSEGEQAIEELLEVSMASGTAAINIIPDRNYKQGVKDGKLKNLQNIIELAERLHLPIIVGTEMNSPGQKFVDSFGNDELKPFVPIFLKGAHIVYAHSVLQRNCGLGYTSSWAKENFNSIADKNEFFHKVGRTLEPQQQDVLENFSEDSMPEQILEAIG